ncbi:MAG: DUF4351 domain-containing protein [Magnetococcus sp. YQC-5]
MKRTGNLFNTIISFGNLWLAAHKAWRGKKDKTRFEQWAHDYEMKDYLAGRQKGQQEGRQEGEAKILVRQLMRRFGELPAAIHEKITMANPNTLEMWADLVLDARSLEDVFGPDLSSTH